MTILYRGSTAKPTILYFHGGGFCLGIYPANRAFVAWLAHETGQRVILPDYRLAPEHPYPAALEDAVAVMRAMPTLAPMGFALAGDSSGCALAISALLTLNRNEVAGPTRIGCITPVFDLAGRGETLTSLSAKDPFQMPDPLSVAKRYLGENDPLSPLISPLYGDLRGLPPIHLLAAERDVFLSDAERFAQKARAAGVEVSLTCWRGLWHVFPMQHRFVPEARSALRAFCDAFQKPASH